MITVQERKIPYHHGMSVIEALKEAGIPYDPMEILLVDRYIARPDDLLRDEQIVQLLRIVSGG